MSPKSYFRLLLITGFNVLTIKSTPTKILQGIVQQAFANNSRLLYFYQPLSMVDVDWFLKSYPFPRKVFYLSTSLDIIPEDVEGYLFDFSAENVSVTTKRNVMLNINPHTRAMVILNASNPKSASVETFIRILSYKAVDVITIQLNCSGDENCTGNIYLEFNGEYNVVVNEETSLDTNIFSLKPWKPVFSKTFRVGLFNCSPFVMFNKNDEPNSGVEFNLMKHITKEFPVEYVKINGTGNKAFGATRKAVITGKADLGVCALWMVNDDYQETETVTKIFPHDNLCTTYLVPKPILYIGFLYPYFPLHPNLWLAIFVSVLLIYLTLLALDAMLSKMGSRSLDRSAAFLHVIRILSSGSVPSSSNGWSAALKQLLLPWSITCMILTATYSAGVTSTMGVPEYTNPIRTYNDIVEQRLKLVGTPPYIHDVCKNSENPILTQLRYYFVNDAKVSPNEPYGIFVKRLRGRYVMNAEHLSESQKNTYIIMNECLLNLYLTLLVPKKSPFRDFFDGQSLLLQEHGIMSVWKRNLTYGGRFSFMRKLFVEHEPSYDYEPVDIHKIKGAVLFLSCGYALATLAFLNELRNGKKFKRN